MAEKIPALKQLRKEIDKIDDSIHDLLMNRASVANKIRKTKDDGRPMYRPEREAEILYRLSSRHHGAYPKHVLLKIWRELISGTLMLEGPFVVSVHTADNNDAYMDLARDHFGSYTPLIQQRLTDSVFEDVCSGNATIGILPLPKSGGADAYCHNLINSIKNGLYVVCRLPFFMLSNADGQRLDALVISSTCPGISGNDKTLFSLRVKGSIKELDVKLAFSYNKLDARIMLHSNVADKQDSLILIEIDGFIRNVDFRLNDALDRLKNTADQLTWLGSYAKPITDIKPSAGPDNEYGPERYDHDMDKGNSDKLDVGSRQ